MTMHKTSLHPLEQQFRDYVKEQHLFDQQAMLLIAVSGGVDSVVLCELCHRAGYRFAILHCNFHLRGKESDRDEGFVRELARHYGCEVLVRHFETARLAEAQKKGIQELARELRYSWFAEVRQQKLSATAMDIKILTAHHLDDSIETSVMNFFKGTGIAGIRGIQPLQRSPSLGLVARPLLFADKKALLAFAEANGLAWVEDSSNASDDYTRNFFRRQVLPLVQQVMPGAGQNLAANLRRFAEAEQLYRQAISTHKKKLLQAHGKEVHIPVLKLKKTVPLHSVLYEIIRDYGFAASQTAEVAALLDSETGRYVRSGTHRVIRNRAWLIIASLATDQPVHLLIEDHGSTGFPGGLLVLSQEAAGRTALPGTGTEAVLDADLVRFPLLLRPWKAGDYFYPLGMRKKKKIARFLIDRKLSKTEKEKVWVLEMDHKIIWVVGQRIDDRFRVTPATRNLLHLTVR